VRTSTCAAARRRASPSSAIGSVTRMRSIGAVFASWRYAKPRPPQRRDSRHTATVRHYNTHAALHYALFVARQTFQPALPTPVVALNHAHPGCAGVHARMWRGMEPPFSWDNVHGRPRPHVARSLRPERFSSQRRSEAPIGIRGSTLPHPPRNA